MNKSGIFLLMFGCVIVYLTGNWVDLMDHDASQYASISREMLLSGSWLQVYDQGINYLDKPPLLFWSSALSMKIFGINHFAYRLPSLLVLLLGIYSTYRLAMLYYDRKMAMLAAIILATSQAVLSMSHDVRTDLMLMGWVAFAIWQWAQALHHNKLRNYLLAFAGIGMAMLSKGPIGLIVPALAIGSEAIIKQKWHYFFKWQYIPGLVVTGLVLLPMCIGLYQQFDLHPEKLLKLGAADQPAETGVSGLKFFFWTQSFGRITGENKWKDDSGVFFYLHNLAWAFLPWVMFFFGSWLLKARNLFSVAGRRTQSEWLSWGGFTLAYIALSMSHFKLPHYIFVVLPLAAIITAPRLYLLSAKLKYQSLYKIAFWFHWVVFALMLITLVVLVWVPFPDEVPRWKIILPLIILGVYPFVAFRKSNFLNPLLRICIYTILGINLVMNTCFYPALLQYQVGSKVGRWVVAQKIPDGKFVLYQYSTGKALSFYSKRITKYYDRPEQVQPGDFLLMEPKNIGQLNNAGIQNQQVFSGRHYHVSMLSLPFLSPSKRDAETKPYVVVKVIEK